MKHAPLFVLICLIISAPAGGAAPGGQEAFSRTVRNLWPKASKAKTGRELLEGAYAKSPGGLLIKAAIQGSAKDVQDALKNGDPNWREPESQQSLLHYAVENPNPGVAGALLQAGAHPMAVDENGETALHWAARYPKVSVDLVSELLKRGCMPRAENDKGETALMTAIQSTNLQFLEAFRAAGGQLTFREKQAYLVFRCMSFIL